MSLYSKRGVSAQKEEVHAATKNLDQGLFPKAFCKIYPDHLGGDENFVNVMHALLLFVQKHHALNIKTSFYFDNCKSNVHA